MMNELLKLRQQISEMKVSEENRKQMEKALRQTENKYKTLLDTLPQKIFHKDENLVYVSCNENYARDLKIKPEEILGKTDFDFFPKELAEKYRADDKRIMAYGRPETIEEEYIQEGQKIYVQTVKTPVKDKKGNVSGILGIFWDITRRKQAEEALRKSYDELEQRVKERTAELVRLNEQLRKEINERKQVVKTLRESEAQKQAILDASVDMIMQVDKEMRIVWANKMAAQVVNKNPADLIGHTCHKFFQDSDYPCPGCPCKKALETGKIEHGTMYQPAMDVVGESYWEDYGVPLRDESGQVVGVIEIARNITEKVKAEQALRSAKEEWEHTFDAITDMVMVLDSEHRIMRANKATAKLLNTTKEDLVGKKCYELLHGQDHPVRRCPLAVTMKTLSAHTEEITIPQMGGIFICSTYPIVGNGGKLIGYTHTLQDVTEARRLESQLLQAQKMEAIGTLAGGIAHDFNNLLMGILGNASLMLLDIDPLHPYYKRLKSIEKQVQSGAKLTNQLLGYARKGRYELKPLDLNESVKESSYAFGRTRREITICLELAEDLFTIEADQGQIEQVLWNLYVNAADAMPGGGKLILKTTNVTHPARKDRPYRKKPGNYILLTVTDTGIGMDKKTQERIFEPFFTTKKRERGTGLGLASVYGIIKGHGGYIDVKSQKGQGTTFSIYLPASKEKPLKEIKATDKIIKGTETVLLVDDEEIILEVGQELLEAMGYQVLLARDGKEAIEIYKKNRDNIDLVVLDMIMPNMGGSETYDRLKEINSNIKVLLSSGYSLDGQATEILKKGCQGFIQKPFSIPGLSEKIRAVLGKDKRQSED